MSFTITDAILIATEAHRGVKDKGGVPYILHPLEIMHNLKKKGYSNECLMTAVLHDVIEDTEWTIEMLEQQQCTESVITALKLLTHIVDEVVIKDYITKNTCGYYVQLEVFRVRCEAKEVEYLNYIERLSKNDIARVVKKEDLKHNSDLTRLNKLDDYAGKRLLKYGKAMKILSPTVGY